MVADAAPASRVMRRKVIASRQLVPRLMLAKVGWVCMTDWYLEHSVHTTLWF